MQVVLILLIGIAIPVQIYTGRFDMAIIVTDRIIVVIGVQIPLKHKCIGLHYPGYRYPVP